MKMEKKMIAEGKYVVIDYKGAFENGEVFDTSVGARPLEFQSGLGMMIPGIEKAVVDMNVGDEKNVVILPADGYGDYDKTLMHEFPIGEIRESFEPEVGMRVMVEMGNGRSIPAEISSITEDKVVFDMNHPLAGKTLHFWVKVLEINDNAKYSSQGCGCSDSSCSDSGCGDEKGTDGSGSCGCGC
jgi:peptidylprolyl isomerase